MSLAWCSTHGIDESWVWHFLQVAYNWLLDFTGRTWLLTEAASTALESFATCLSNFPFTIYFYAVVQTLPFCIWWFSRLCVQPKELTDNPSQQLQWLQPDLKSCHDTGEHSIVWLLLSRSHPTKCEIQRLLTVRKLSGPGLSTDSVTASWQSFAT